MVTKFMKTTFNSSADVYSPRFQFGKNWRGFAEEIDEKKIQKAEIQEGCQKCEKCHVIRF